MLYKHYGCASEFHLKADVSICLFSRCKQPRLPSNQDPPLTLDASSSAFKPAIIALDAIFVSATEIFESRAVRMFDNAQACQFVCVCMDALLHSQEQLLHSVHASQFHSTDSQYHDSIQIVQ